jgi:hypothetical protein
VHHDVFFARYETEAGAPVLPPCRVLGAHEYPGARDFLAGQAEAKKCTSLMFGGVNRGLVQDEAGVGNQDLILMRRAEVLKANLDAGSAHPGEEPAGGAAVEVNANRKLFPAERQRCAQARDGFDWTFPKGENLVYVRIAFQEFQKTRLDKHGGKQVGSPSFKQM